MRQSRSADPYRTVRIFSQRAIALAVLVSGCVCEDALMTYAGPSEPSPSASLAAGAFGASGAVDSPPPGAGDGAPVSVMPLVWTSSHASAPSRLEVVPAEVFTLVGLPFEMRARSFDASSNMIPILDEGAVEWTIAPASGVVLTPLSPGRVIITVTSLGADYTLTATHPVTGLTARATIKPVKLESLATEDWIAGVHTAQAPPTLALVDAKWQSPGTFDDDKLFAFAGGGSLGAIVAGCSADPLHCGETTLFATENALTRDRFSWSSGPGCDLADYRDPRPTTTACSRVVERTLSNRVTIPLKVWGFSPAASDGEVRADLGFFKSALRDAWGGAQIAEQLVMTGELRNITLDFDAGGVTCAPSVFDRLITEFNVTGLGPNKATIVVVDQLFRRGSNGLPELAWFGYACPYDSQYGAVAFVDWNRRHLTTTAHEVGHVLGPWDINDTWGHMETVSAPASNLMLGTEESIDFPRWTLTLGQAFRYTLDKNAIINRSAPASLERCPVVLPAGSKCPAITKDVP
jgi:hypothetical protein